MNKIIYFHIPKTAGSTIRELMMQNCEKKKLLQIHSIADFAYKTDYELYKYQYIMGHIGFAFSTRIDALFNMFTFLREPVERVVSLYYYWKSNPQLLWHGERRIINNPSHQYSLEKFLDLGFVNGVVMEETLNTQTWQMFHGLEMHTRMKFRNFSESEILEKAKENISKMDFVGFTDDFENSIASLCHMFNWRIPDQIPKLRITPKKPAMEEINSRIIEKIKSLVYLDQALYSYAYTYLRKE